MNEGSKVDFVIDFVGGKETEKAAYRIIKDGGQLVTAVRPATWLFGVAIKRSPPVTLKLEALA